MLTSREIIITQTLWCLRNKSTKVHVCDGRLRGTSIGMRERSEAGAAYSLGYDPVTPCTQCHPNHGPKGHTSASTCQKVCIISRNLGEVHLCFPCDLFTTIALFGISSLVSSAAAIWKCERGILEVISGATTISSLPFPACLGSYFS